MILFVVQLFSMSHYIYDFIRSLNDTEIKSVKEYLKASTSLSRSGVEESKHLLLFNLLLAPKSLQYTDEEIAQKVPTKNLISLRSELLSKISEALTLSKSIENNNGLDERMAHVYLLKKKLLFLRIIASNRKSNRSELVMQLFFDIIIQAKKTESYDVLVEALRFQKYYRGIRTDFVEFDKIQEEIDFYNECNDAVWFATDCYNKIIMNNDLIKFMSPKEQLDFIDSSIGQLEKKYSKTKSQQVFYYMQILKLEYNEINENYKEAIKQAEKLINYLPENSVIYTKLRMGYAYDNLSRFYAFDGNFKKSIKILQIAQRHFKEDTFPYLISKEGEFKIYFHIADLIKAGAILNTISKHNLVDSGKFRESKIIFYKACIYFAQKKFKEALEQIRTNMEIEKDKSGWNIYLRLLNTMTLIELGKVDEAMASIESMRKYKERMQKDEEAGITERHWIICDVLKDWEKSSFTFHINDKKMLETAKKLSEKGEAYSWKMFGNELIPFHTWFEEKIKK